MSCAHRASGLKHAADGDFNGARAPNCRSFVLVAIINTAFLRPDQHRLMVVRGVELQMATSHCVKSLRYIVSMDLTVRV